MFRIGDRVRRVRGTQYSWYSADQHAWVIGGEGVVVERHTMRPDMYQFVLVNGVVVSVYNDCLELVTPDKFLLYKDGRVISPTSVLTDGAGRGNDAWTRPEIDTYTAEYLGRHGTGEFHVVPLRSVATINQNGTTEHV